MSSPAEKPSLLLELVPATAEQAPILANLLELYAHDFSEFFEVALGADGRFGYKEFPLYWSEPGRFPFLIRVNSQLAGFVLVRFGSQITGNQSAWDMAEFFVVRGHRKRGIGTEIAHRVWRQFPGQWEIRVMQRNSVAHRFWERAVKQFAGESLSSTPFEKNGLLWTVFAFESLPPTVGLI